MKKLEINISRKDLYTLFKIYRKTIAYCLIAIVIYSLVDKIANNFATREVIVASRDLSSGTVLTNSDLTTSRIPISGIAPNSLKMQEIIGKMLTSNISSKEQITSSRLISSNKNDKNQRIVGIRINDSEIASILKPGAIVDVVKLNNSQGIFGGLIAQKVMVVALAEKKSSFGSNAGLVVLVSTSTNDAMNLAINSGEKLTVLLH
ncbi:MAG: Chaperone for flagella basal body P-ring formation [Actinomycetota bacterium]|jgi:Flp pilus assembly protein CpaB